MAVDFMVQQGLSRNNIFICCIVLFSHCAFQKDKEKKELIVDMSTIVLKIQKGNTYADDKLFSGKLYALFPYSNDTVEIRHYLEGREDGCWKQFYPNAKLKEIRFFKEGKKEGRYEGWWENGSRKLDYSFLEGEYEGTCREWSPVGRLIKEMNYHSGHEEGSQKVWYDNGKIRSNYVITNGRRYGLLGTKNCMNVSDSIF